MSGWFRWPQSKLVCCRLRATAFAVLIAATFFYSGSLSAGVQALEELVLKASQTDRSVLIREHAGWDRNCEAIAHPPLYLSSPPRYGKVCVREEKIKITSLYAGTESQCIGHLVRGVRLIYRSDPAYVGDDSLRYAAQYPSVVRTVSVNITIAPYPSAPSGASSSSSEVSASARQSPGPVPVCPDFLF